MYYFGAVATVCDHNDDALHVDGVANMIRYITLPWLPQ